MRRLAKVPVWILFAGWFVFLSCVSAMVTVGVLVRQNEDVEVPNLIGKTLSEAQHLASVNHLKLQVLGSDVNETVPVGNVLFQSVSGGELVRSGRTLELRLSKGPRERQAVRVIGLEEGAARKVLEPAGLQIIVSAMTCSNEYDRGVIVSQFPAPGVTAEGSGISVITSSGSCDRFVMPRISGMSLTAGIEVLLDSDIRSRFLTYEVRPDVPEDTIVGVEPTEGAILQHDSPIRIHVARKDSTEPGISAIEGERWTHLSLPGAQGFLRHQARLRVDRSEPFLSYAIDFLLAPGQNADFLLYLPPGSRVEFTEDGQERWTQTY